MKGHTPKPKRFFYKQDTYIVPVNEPDGEDGSVTAEVIRLTGTHKAKAKQFRRYLRQRAGIVDFHAQTATIRALGFTRLLPR